MLHEVEGFLAQTGGWDSERQNEAGVLALWRRPEHYQAFMDRVHDRVVAASGQDRSYRRIRIELFRLAASGTPLARELSEVFTRAQSIHLAPLPACAIRVTLQWGEAKEEDFIASPSASEGSSLSTETISRDSLLRVEPAWRVRSSD